MYTVYKITNTLNEKTYVGVHKTEYPHDSYMGSGLAIKAAIKKYGRDKFTKTIMMLTADKQEAYQYEKELTADFNANTTYNMKRGGVGGFRRENALKGYNNSLALLTAEQRSETGKRVYAKSLGICDSVASGRKGGQANRGKPKSEKHKQNIRDAWIKKKLMANSSIGGTFCS